MNRNFISQILLMLIFVLMFSFAFSQTKSENKSSLTKANSQFDKYLGKTFPDFSIKHFDSVYFSNKNFNGKIVFINFWNEHCSPCIAEMSGLNQLYHKLNMSPDFLFVSFSDDVDSVIKKSVIKNEIDFNVYRLSKDKFSQLNFNQGIPTNIILDKNGAIRFFKSGGYTDKNKASDYIMTVIYPKIIEILK